MTHDDIIRMAREAVRQHPDWTEEEETPTDEELEVLIRFAALVAAAERGECAKVCDQHADEYADLQDFHGLHAAESLAESIRARGQNV